MYTDDRRSKGGIVNLTIRDKSSLYDAYMPFIKNGGIFIPTDKSYRINDEVFLVVTLIDSKDKLPVAGRVVWVTPKGASKGAGIGVQFSFEDKGSTRSKIETLLAGALRSDRPTRTM
ncbi:MAG: PilZ domain-containing protein [Gammaproteobacteria bacterium]